MDHCQCSCDATIPSCTVSKRHGWIWQDFNYLLDLVVARGEGAAHSVADLVVRHQRLALAVCHGGSLHASHDAVHTVINFAQRDGALSAPSCEDGGLHPDHALQKRRNTARAFCALTELRLANCALCIMGITL